MANSFNPFSPHFNENPYPYYDQLRENTLLTYQQISPNHSFWFVSTHHDINTVLNDSRFVREHKTVFPDAAIWTPPEDQKEIYASLRNWVLFTDHPRHTRLRKHISSAFQKSINYKQLAHVAQDLTHTLIEKTDQEIDILHQFAIPLPVQLFSTILGLPIEDWEKLKKWSDVVVNSFDISNQPEADKRMANSVVLEMNQYFMERIEQRRKKPQEDLISKLLESDSEGNYLTDDELVANLIFLLGAGHETTTSLIANGLFSLFRHPDELAKLKDRKELLSSAVEETLRFESPIQMTFRIASEDVELKGNTLKKGQQVCLLLGSGNRDEQVFSNGNSFTIERHNANRHLAFAAGPHFCIGSHLAKMEASIAISAFIETFPNAELASNAVEWKKNPSFRVMEYCKVHLNKLASHPD